METSAFLSKLWPTTGYKALMTVFNKDGKDLRRHIYDNDTAKLEQHILTLDNEYKQPVYFALASFVDNKHRTHANASKVKAFWLDVDCGEDKAAKGRGYLNQREAIVHLVAMVKAAHLPPPMIVSSGTGIHVYWPLTSEISAASWTQIAQMLKAVVHHAGYLADPARTADVASVLRPVGSHNRKSGVELSVRVLKDADSVDVVRFASTLMQYVKGNNVKITQTKDTKSKHASDLNAALYSGTTDSSPSDPLAVSAGCAQVRALRDSNGNLEEPLWYAVLGVLHHCTDGDKAAHEWSSGYKGYSAEETDRKLAQLDKVGPTTCARFSSLNPNGCTGCPFADKITTPLQIGRGAGEQLEAPTLASKQINVARATTALPTALDLPPPPHPFRRLPDGLYAITDDVPNKFFDRDLYPIQVVYDESVHSEMVRVRYDKPNHGVVEFAIKMSDMAEPKELTRQLFNNGVIIPSIDGRKIMTHYLSNYVKELQKKFPTTQLYTSMGWKNEDKAFVLGSSVIDATGGELNVGMSTKLRDTVSSAFATSGNLEEWVKLVDLLNAEQMEPHQFALCCGFGAVLFKFTRLEAVVVNMLGRTGSGKSSIQKLVASIFGNYRETMLSDSDTENAKFKRIGIYCHLPVVVEETTNQEPEVMANFILHVTRGRERLRLNSDASENSGTGFWNTIILTSSNASMIAKLGMAKPDSEAEAMRLFEFPIPYTPGFDDWMGKHFPRVLDRHYGHAGRKYIKALLAIGPTRLDAEVSKMYDYVASHLQLRSQERYWCGAIACAMLGGRIAKALGLINFDPVRSLEWIGSSIHGLRTVVSENVSDAIDILAEYLLENIDNRIIVNDSRTNAPRGLSSAVKREPNRKLTIRVEESQQVMYISKPSFRDFLNRKRTEYKVVKEELVRLGVMIQEKQYYLGKGTDIASTQIWCMQLDLKNVAMSGVLKMVVNNDAPTGDVALQS